MAKNIKVSAYKIRNYKNLSKWQLMVRVEITEDTVQ